MGDDAKVTAGQGVEAPLVTIVDMTDLLGAGCAGSG
jgi:hypothetical protein